jgi:ribosomal protein S18 acetylase RimI-like enzyme
MSVRCYASADFPAVCRIYLEAKPDELRFESGHFEFTPLEQDPVILPAFLESSVLVYDDGEVQGFSAIFEGQLRALFVRRRARARGVGQALLSAVLADASGDVSLNVAASNVDAIRFYQKSGFSITRETNKKYSGIDVRYIQMLHASAVQIRSTTEDDWQELKRIRLLALQDAPKAFGVSYASASTYTDDAWRDRAAGRGPARYFLAFDGHAAVGIVAHVFDANHEQNLIAMWVAPRLRGSSTASRLVDSVKAQGHQRLLLDVAPANERAVAFYQKQGFSFLPQWETLESHPHIKVQKMEWKAAPK